MFAAALVAGVWAAAAAPILLGASRCPTAWLLRVACPGCGMSRALRLLADGHVRASLEMHALALPTALSQALLALATIAATLRFGAPWALFRARWGRAAVALVGLVLAADVALWAARALGAFGGPVPV